MVVEISVNGTKYEFDPEDLIEVEVDGFKTLAYEDEDGWAHYVDSHGFAAEVQLVPDGE